MDHDQRRHVGARRTVRGWCFALGVIACVATAAWPVVAQQAASTTPAVGNSPWMERFARWHGERAPALVELYRWLHEHPELSLGEEATAGHLAAAWAKQGLTVTRQVGGHGVVGVLENGPGMIFSRPLSTAFL